MTAVSLPSMPAYELQSRRVKAGWVDIVLLILLGIVLTVLLGHSSTLHASGTVNGKAFHNTTHTWSLTGAGALIWIGLALLYYFLSEWLTGQTLGKRLMHVRVTTLGGEPPGPVAVLIRAVARVIDVLPFFYLLGWLVMRFGSDPRQRIGDRLARTTVSPAV